ncbi:MAG TPA: NAD-dependent epimerase/dehydratase family protein [Desulfobacteraceae bacterium]|nr:NAD-dependent epimerase/dehydratase family protein [Desulfobacteraceae bacterium]
MRWLKCDLSASRDPLEDVGGLDAVVHLAARAHVLDEKELDPLDEYRRVNVQGSLRVAGSAARHGAERFVFISSIGVNGNRSFRPFKASDPPAPVGPYAVSKHEAETGLNRLCADLGMELVIIRPPLVYGPSAPGNFGRLVKVVRSGLPLPFAAVRNKRSLVALVNLVDLITVCIDHPAAAGRIFPAADGEDISTPSLIRKLARAAGRPARLFPVPPALLTLLGRLTGRGADMEKLTGSLEVDISDTCETLGWRPPVSMDRALSNSV